MTISEQIKKINTSIAELNNLKTFIQSQCKHELASGKFKGNTGNYDPSDDYYWVEIYCPTCQKYWSIDQDNISLYDYTGLYITKEGVISKNQNDKE